MATLNSKKVKDLKLHNVISDTDQISTFVENSIAPKRDYRDLTVGNKTWKVQIPAGSTKTQDAISVRWQETDTISCWELYDVNGTFATDQIRDKNAEALTCIDNDNLEYLCNKTYSNYLATLSDLNLSTRIATSDYPGTIKIGFELDKPNQNYPVQLSDDKAYVNVPWVDVAIESAWYVTDDRTIVIKFNDPAKDQISVNVSALVDVYEGDGTTIELNGNVFSVKDGVFQSSGNYVSSDTLTSDYYDKSTIDNKINGINTALDKKLYIGSYNGSEYSITSADALSIVNISYDNYCDLINDGQLCSGITYVISSDQLNANNKVIKNVSSPTSSSDAANKDYVDTAIKPLSGKTYYLSSDLSTLFNELISTLGGTLDLTMVDE